MIRTIREKATLFHLAILVVLALAFSLSSCKKTYRAVVKERSERIDAFAEELRELKDNLPDVPPGAPKFVSVDATAGVELPYFHIKDDNSNTAIILTDAMDDIRTLEPEYEGDYFDFHGSALMTLQKMAHPESGRDEGWFANRVDRLLDARYLLVLDLKEVEEVKVVDDESFSGGVIRLEGHFYDRGRKMWLGSFPIEGIPRSGYAYGEENSLRSKMISDIRRNAQNAACEQIDQILENGVGGFFEFDYDGPGIDGQAVPYSWE